MRQLELELETVNRESAPADKVVEAPPAAEPASQAPAAEAGRPAAEPADASSIATGSSEKKGDE